MTAGRPTTYRPEYAEQARKLCRNGATDREIADILGVCVRTFYRWRAEYDAFAEALTAGKEFADDRVERALYERACGYEYSDVKIFHPSGAKEPVIVPITVHVPADVGAAKQWLATRRPPAPPEPPENTSFVERFRKAMARVDEGRAETQAAEARHFAERVETRVSEELARYGLQA
ncbi:MAG: helix-turn-helix domain-containing protein [Sphingomonas bacterium]